MKTKLLLLSLISVLGPLTSCIGNDTVMIKPAVSGRQSVYQDINFPTTHPFSYDGIVIRFGTGAGKVPILDGSGFVPVGSLPVAVADGSSKGIATYTANDFNVSGGVVSIDYPNGQAATNSVPGFFTAADHASLFGNKSANTVYAGPASGSAAPPTFRALVDADIPDILSLTRIPNLTSNGFVRTTTGDGTLTVTVPTATGTNLLTLTNPVTTGYVKIGNDIDHTVSVVSPGSLRTDIDAQQHSSNLDTYSTIAPSSLGALLLQSDPPASTASYIKFTSFGTYDYFTPTELRNDIAAFKVYRATLTQTGTSAPTATVLENTLGGTVVWSYQSLGTYRATLTGAFTSAKTHLILGVPLFQEDEIHTITAAALSSANFVEVHTQADTAKRDDVLSSTAIEIKVYP